MYDIRIFAVICTSFYFIMHCIDVIVRWLTYLYLVYFNVISNFALNALYVHVIVYANKDDDYYYIYIWK